jgi:sirohydrochlorin cobaltochelatase
MKKEKEPRSAILKVPQKAILKAPQKAIVLAAFGTKAPGAEKAFTEIERRVREKHRGIGVRWAFTSKTVRSRAATDGRELCSPETAFSRLTDEGFTHVVVLPLYIVPGQEFQGLCLEAERFQAENTGLDKIEIARPLVANYEDMQTVCEILADKFSRQDPHEGSIFIGHGNCNHPSGAIYAAMNSLLMARRSRLFCGTVLGHPTPAELLSELKAAKVWRVTLVPLMTLAGEHARKDIAGNEHGSWKSILAENGIESEPVFTGLAENPDIIPVWLDHLEEAFSKL